MRLDFGFTMSPAHRMYWQDGLWAALRLLVAEGWKMTDEKADFKLYWGNPADAPEDADGLCYGGGPLDKDFLKQFKVVFLESQIDIEKAEHPNKVKAFGTNTELFVPKEIPKIIDALYPAAFAIWKHQEKFAKICKQEKKKGLAVGYMQPDNPTETNYLIKKCIDNGVAVMDWIPTNSLVNLYNMSKEVIITASEIGGCQRTVLEAKACGVPVRVESKSRKLLELKDLTREEVLKDWSERSYASQLKEGILNALQ